MSCPDCWMKVGNVWLTRWVILSPTQTVSTGPRHLRLFSSFVVEDRLRGTNLVSVRLPLLWILSIISSRCWMVREQSSALLIFWLSWMDQSYFSSLSIKHGDISRDKRIEQSNLFKLYELGFLRVVRVLMVLMDQQSHCLLLYYLAIKQVELSSNSRMKCKNTTCLTDILVINRTKPSTLHICKQIWLSSRVIVSSYII